MSYELFANSLRLVWGLKKCRKLVSFEPVCGRAEVKDARKSFFISEGKGKERIGNF